MLREPRVSELRQLPALLKYFGAWPGLVWYWLVPFCTWHIAAQYIRLTCEHSAVEADDEYGVTRTTLRTRLEAAVILPRNIGFQIEHHCYRPSYFTAAEAAPALGGAQRLSIAHRSQTLGRCLTR